MTAGRRRGLHVLALSLLVLAGAALRFERGRSGLPYLHHWDEPFLVDRAIVMAETGDPNPRFFNYGSLRIYLDAPAAALAARRLERLPPGHPERLDPAVGVRFRGAPEDDLRRRARGLPPWWISHPSLVRACRALSALYGALAILLAATLARRLDGRLAALGAATIVAFDPMQITHASIATVDVLATATALAVLAASQRFLDLGRQRDLALACLAVGLTASAKYNIALVGVVPAIALAQVARRRPRGRWGRWLLLGPLLALASFVATSPFLFLDFARATGDVGRMAANYLGSAPEKIPRGWPHLAADLAELARNLSPAVVAAGLIGLAVLARRRRGGTVLFAAAALLILNAVTRTAFHRNLLLLYPLAAIAAGVGLAAITRRASEFGSAATRPRRRAAIALALLLGAALPLAARASARVRSAVRPPPRTLALLELARRPELARRRVAVAAELGLHPIDRARWKGRLVERPLVEIACAPGRVSAVLVPRAVESRSGLHRERAERLELALTALGEPLWQAGTEALPLDRPSAWAGVVLRRPPPAPPDASLCASPPTRAARGPDRGGSLTGSRAPIPKPARRPR